MDDGIAGIEEFDPEAAPGQRHIIRRPRLERLLDETQARIILLVAPAGYGKTTLARQWTISKGACWYGSTTASSDVVEFARGIIRTSEKLLPPGSIAVGAEMLFAEGTLSANEIAVRASSAITEWPPNTWLVIDDYHLASGNESEDFLAALIERCPLNLMITSRQRPKWATARHRLYGQIFELGAAELAMAIAEGTAVLSNRPPEDLPELLALADGWPAVIGLAALVDSLPKAPSQLSATLFEFLTDELYRNLAQAERRALCALAWAPGIEIEKAGPILSLAGCSPAAINSTALTTIAEGRLTLHPLVRAFLCTRTRAELAAEQLHELFHILAGLGLSDDAYTLGTEFGLFDAIVELLESSLQTLLDQGRTATISRWTEELRRAGVVSAVLELAEAQIAFRHGSYSEAEATAIRCAESAMTRQLRCRALTLAGHSAHLDSAQERASEYYTRAQEEAESEDDAWAALWGELLTATEQDPSAATALVAAFEKRGAGSPERQLRVESARLFSTCFGGGIVESLPRGRAALPLLGSVDDPFIRTSFLNSLSYALVFSAEYEEGLEITSREYEDASTHGLPFVLAHAKIAEAVALAGLRRFAEAIAALDEARAKRATHDVHAYVNELLVRARVAASLGDLEVALRLTEQAPAEMPSRTMGAEWFATRSLIRQLADTHEGETVRRSQHGPNADALARTLDAINASIRAIHAGSDPGAATLFDFVRRTGHFDSLVVAYRTHPPLLKALADDPAVRPPLLALLAKARDHDAARAVDLRLDPHSDPRELLSPREREVYELLAHGLSNREIATKLYISSVTVKVHVRHILEKLGVKTRTQAALLATRAPRG